MLVPSQCINFVIALRPTARQTYRNIQTDLFVRSRNQMRTPESFWLDHHIAHLAHCLIQLVVSAIPMHHQTHAQQQFSSKGNQTPELFSSPSKHNTPTRGIFFKRPRDDPLPHMGLTLPTQNEKITFSELLALEETPNPKTVKKVQQL